MNPLEIDNLNETIAQNMYVHVSSKANERVFDICFCIES